MPSRVQLDHSPDQIPGQATDTHPSTTPRLALCLDRSSPDRLGYSLYPLCPPRRHSRASIPCLPLLPLGPRSQARPDFPAPLTLPSHPSTWLEAITICPTPS